MKFGLKDEILNRINAVFAQFPQIDEVILYGSRAKGNFKIGSDIDLTLKGKEISLKEILQLESALDDLMLPYSFDISNFDKISDIDLIDHINRVGVLVYKRKF